MAHGKRRRRNLWWWWKRRQRRQLQRRRHASVVSWLAAGAKRLATACIFYEGVGLLN
jgi:hypothetical protein